NLLSNAIKYNRRNGRVKLWADSDAERIKILVEDSGEGMSESDLARIFNPFERLKWQQSEIKGLGLGLPLSKKLAQKMSGDLELESHVGQGTRVWLELPRSEAPATAEPASSNSRESAAQYQAAQHQAATLLLVEDDPFNQEFMADHIKSLGHTLLLAGNGCEALELLNQQQVDLIITDCNMPEMDGLTLCRAIRSEKSGKHQHTPIIATTALTNDANLQACKAAGVNKALHKPVDLKALTNSINLLLSQSNQLLPTHQAPASSHSSQSLSSIDHSTLEDYVGDKPLLRTRLLKTYLTLISSDIPKLLRAFHRQDMSAASKLAHKLRPASITVGARPLASLLHRIETMDLHNPADLYPD
ncbi:MAG: response regulator, partial [Cyanobacteriota bacterium]|nr:response regulator [Cyanobacteriota bacterium]